MSRIKKDSYSGFFQVRKYLKEGKVQGIFIPPPNKVATNFVSRDAHFVSSKLKEMCV